MKSKKSLLIVMIGYIFNLGLYRILHLYGRKPYFEYFEKSAIIVFGITIFFFVILFLIFSILPFQKSRSSFFLASVITTSLTFFSIPFVNYVQYNGIQDHRLTQVETDKTIALLKGSLSSQAIEPSHKEKSEPERKLWVAKNKEVQKQLKEAKRKIQAERNSKKEMEAQLNKTIAISDAASKNIAELQAKLESERQESEKLRKQLNDTIIKGRSKDRIILSLRSKLGEKHKTKGDVSVQANSTGDAPEGKNKNAEVDNPDADTINQEINFKVQVLSSGTRLATNSQRFKGLKNVWEYKDGGLYKYTVGNKKNLKSASASQSELRRKGFTGAFVVPFKNGERISVKEALKLLK